MNSVLLRSGDTLPTKFLSNGLKNSCGYHFVFLQRSVVVFLTDRRKKENDGPMPEDQRVANNSQTYVANAEEFQFETLEQQNGQATVIRFRLEDPRYHAGDVLVVLSGSEIHFHGMIGQVAEGWAIASDPRGSLLAATVQ